MNRMDVYAGSSIHTKYRVPNKTFVIPTPERKRGAEESLVHARNSRRQPFAFVAQRPWCRGRRRPSAGARTAACSFTSIQDLARRVPECARMNSTPGRIGALNSVASTEYPVPGKKLVIPIPERKRGAEDLALGAGYSVLEASPPRALCKSSVPRAARPAARASTEPDLPSQLRPMNQ